MILKDLSFAWRNLRKNKLLAAINVLGLSIGISACLVIFLIVHYEMNFDRFHSDRDRIYRVYSTFTGEMNGVNRGVPTGFSRVIRDQFTGLESVTHFHQLNASVEVTDPKGVLNDYGDYDRIIIADPDYFELFNNYQWIAGSPISLSDPFNVVLTENRARTYFGHVDPLAILGKEIRYRDSLIVTVSGVVKDIDHHTDLHFTDFISFSTIEKSWLTIDPDNWNNINSSSQIFVKLANGTDKEKIEAQLPLLWEANPEHERITTWKNTPRLQALADLHFDNELGIFDGSRSTTEKSTLRLLGMVALVLLLMASINFVNMETAQASGRAKEVGIRKVLGSSKMKLVSRFLVESFILSSFAVVFSVLLVAVALPYFSEFLPEGLTFDITDPTIILFLISFIVVVTLLAGLYPSFVLSSGKPALALKNMAPANLKGSHSATIRSGLTIFQFSVSQVMILGCLTIGVQLHYMLNKDLGFDSEAIVYLHSPWWEEDQKRALLKNELSQIPEIDGITLQAAPPYADGYSSTFLDFDNGNEVVKERVFMKYADTSYIHVYGIELLSGRNLLPIDTAKEYLINETYMRKLGFSEPRDVVGQTVNKDFNVVGVVKDFHGRSLHSPIEPTVIRFERSPSSFGLKLNTPRNKIADVGPAMEKIKAAWMKIYPEERFEFAFIRDTIRTMYENEQRVGRLSGIATTIAILISSLGLFGLSTFTVNQRTKEIGIRKTLGATVNNVVYLLSTDFLKLVLAAFVLAAPIAYFLADRWLESFAFRVHLSPWIFVVTGMFSVLIAFATISLHTINAAKADPVKSLRYE